MVRRKRYPAVFGFFSVALLLGGLSVARAAVSLPQAATPASTVLSAAQPIATLTHTPGATPGRAGRAGARLAFTPLSPSSTLTATTLAGAGRAGARLALTPAITATATPQPRDSDGDGVLDHKDDCPLSPNPEQMDSNNNGLGDPCDAPFADGFAFVTADGVIQTRVDDRLRPIHIAAPAAILTLVWSDDASRVEITTEVDGKSDTVALDVDFSDAALLAAIDVAEKETGQDLTHLRTWIHENPGRVLAVARGEQPPPRLTPEARSAAPRSAGLAALMPLPLADMPPKVAAYLENLRLQSANAHALLMAYAEANRDRSEDPAIRPAWNAIWYVAVKLAQLHSEEVDHCEPCNRWLCRMDCGEKGACFTHHPDPYPCWETWEDDCGRMGGVYYLEQRCPGACWFFTGPVAFCTPLAERDCLAIHERSRAGGGQHNVATCFNGGMSCDDPACSP